MITLILLIYRLERDGRLFGDARHVFNNGIGDSGNSTKMTERLSGSDGAEEEDDEAE